MSLRQLNLRRSGRRFTDTDKRGERYDSVRRRVGKISFEQGNRRG